MQLWSDTKSEITYFRPENSPSANNGEDFFSILLGEIADTLI